MPNHRVLAFSIAASLVAGCGGSGGSGAPPAPPATAAPTPSASAPATAAQRPCDVFASATPCVAAYSTVRSLYAAYTGPLYAVQRASDGTTVDVGLLANGYADAAAQDAFCANTTCTIETLFDQSSDRDDLAVAPPGHAATGAGPNGYDLAAVANALPITAAGHEAYGISIVPGMGYRDDVTTGIPTGSQPQGVYMVTTSIGINTKCCFDFGNAETNNDDDGAGRMDAINIICRGTSSACSDDGGLDLENGIYGRLAIASGLPFVTDMGSNDGASDYTIWAGNAQTGGLTTTGPQPLASGYAPMQQEGAIILGIGGDNSDWAAGAFFEGAITRGTPSSAVMGDVQSNIVVAAYALGTTSTNARTRARGFSPAVDHTSRLITRSI